MRWSQVLFLGYIIASAFDEEHAQLLFVCFAATLFVDVAVIIFMKIMSDKRKGGE